MTLKRIKVSVSKHVHCTLWWGFPTFKCHININGINWKRSDKWTIIPIGLARWSVGGCL